MKKKLRQIVGPFNAVTCCVYFLLLSGRVVYVGQTKNGLSRIQQHRTRKGYIKEFDSWAFIECEKDELDALEAKYILSMRPRFNVRRFKFSRKVSHAPTASQVLDALSFEVMRRGDA